MSTGLAAAKHFCATDCATPHPAQTTLGEILHSGADFGKPLGTKNPFFLQTLQTCLDLVDLVLVDLAELVLVDLVDLVDQS